LELVLIVPTAERTRQLSGVTDPASTRKLTHRSIAIGREFAFSDGKLQTVAPWVPFDPSGVEAFDAFEATAEQVFAYEPDLIISRRFAIEYNKPRSDALMNVVPIVPTALLPWRDDVTQIARWLGRTDNSTP
jgi:ABC-type Fe3+-hydroxamate transport system substrate-binding protein